MSEKPFFVGYLPAPGPLRTFLLTACILLIAGLGGAGFLMGAAQDDPGPGAFRFDYVGVDGVIGDGTVAGGYAVNTSP